MFVELSAILVIFTIFLTFTLIFQDIADQRLIYAGHLLDDVQLLTDVFGLNGASNSFQTQSSYQHSGPYTIHLACTSKSYVSPSQRSTR